MFFGAGIRPGVCPLKAVDMSQADRQSFRTMAMIVVNMLCVLVLRVGVDAGSLSSVPRGVRGVQGQVNDFLSHAPLRPWETGEREGKKINSKYACPRVHSPSPAARTAARSRTKPAITELASVSPGTETRVIVLSSRRQQRTLPSSGSTTQYSPPPKR